MFFLMLSIVVLSELLGFALLLSGNVNVPGWFGLVLAQVVLIGVPCGIYLLMHRKKIRDILPMRKLGGKNVAMVFFMSVAIFPVAFFLNVVTTLIFGNPMQETMEAIRHESGFILMLILFPILPSIFEEVALRGIVFSGFTKVKIFTAALINGLFFGILHQNFNQFSYAFVLGFIMCYMMYYTKSIWAPVLCHFVINLTGVLLQYVITRFVDLNAMEEAAQVIESPLPEWVETLIALGVFALFAIIAMGIFIGIYIKFKKHNLQRNEADGIVTDTYAQAIAEGETKPEAFTWGFWGALVIGILWMILLQMVMRR